MEVQEKEETWKKSFLEVMETVNEIGFALHHVTTGFNSTAAFSEASLQLAAYAPNKFRRGLHVKDLFQVDVLKQEYAKALTFIMNCEQLAWPVQPKDRPATRKKREQQVVVEICFNILLPLSREEEVILEKRYTSIPKPAGLRCSYIGMGAVSTWHGTPDVRVRGADVVLVEEEAEVTTEGDESDGATTNSEAKVSSGAAKLPQVIATCVVASFTEKTLHPAKQALVPTLLMDQEQFRVCLYSCENDVLLLSDCTRLAEDGTLSSSGMAFLWLVINHR